MVYDLWDIETGNMIGTFDTERDALALVADLLEGNGLDYADDLDLGIIDENDETRSLATGPALVARVRAAQPVTTAAGAQIP